MKHTGIIISFIFFVLFGIMAGSHLNANIKVQEDNYNANRETETQEVSDIIKANEEMKQRIEELSAQVEAYEKEWATENIILKKLKSDVNHYKMLSGHSPAVGPGVTVILEGVLEENIAPVIEGNKYLITLVNELKYFDAEVIAINGQRLTARSEIVFAGNHININGVPIAPPYQIQAIGDTKKLQRYIEHGTFIFEIMKNNGIRSTIQFEDEINIPAVVREKPIEFLKAVESN
ncbi:DUF881 domain-containing protein [Alkaliphilus crotonatoxidans]